MSTSSQTAPARRPAASVGGDTAADDTSSGSGETRGAVGLRAVRCHAVRSARGAARLDAWWRAANYLAVGQIYLMDNPLLREPLRAEHVKPRLLGHFGTVPGLNLVYAHANRLILERDLDAVFVAGPGHGGPGPERLRLARGHLLRAVQPRRRRTPRGWRRCSGSSPSPAACRATARPRRRAPSTRAASSGYSLLHAYGAVLDNPDLVVFCVVGRRRGRDRAARDELALQQVRQPGPRRGGAADPAPQRLQDRQPDAARADPRGASCCELMRGYGYDPHVVAGDDPGQVHQAHGRRAGHAASTRSREIQRRGPRRRRPDVGRPWPMIVLRTPKGWTCPPVVDGQQVEGTFRAHQVPLPSARTQRRAPRACSRSGCGPTGREELFDDDGRPVPELLRARPRAATGG